MSGWELVGAVLLAWVALSVLVGLLFGALSRTGTHQREPPAANDR